MTTLSRRAFLIAAPAAALPAPRLLVGCQANGFPLTPGDFDALVKALQTMKTLGYAGFECNVRFVEGQFSRAAEARRRIQDTGLVFIGAHMNQQQADSEKGPQLFDGVAALGGRSIVMSGRGLAPDGKFQQPALIQKAGSLEAAGRRARSASLLLAYHNHNPEFANANAEMDGLARLTDPKLVSFLMDAGHGYLGGGDPAAFLTGHWKRVFGIHLKTFATKEVNSQVPLGQGAFDFQALAAAVQRTGWSGWLINEPGGGPKPGNTAMLGSDREHIRKLFGA